MSQDPTATENDLTAKETPVTAARPAAENRPSRPRAGFTLVELMVVIGIIAILAALITPAVIGARTSARNAAIKAEIDMLHMAMMNYKNEYGSFPPCADLDPAANPDGTGRLVSQAQKHLQRLFPRCTTIPGPTGQFQGAGEIRPGNALYSWLGGYTSNPASPLQPPNERKKLYDFDQSRVVGGAYYPRGLKTRPYDYLDAGSYLAVPPPISSADLHQVFTHVQPDEVLANGNRRVTPSWWSNLSEVEKKTWLFSLSSDPAERPHQRIMNEDTFQVFSAGLDEEFGTDDDLSNCWSGTRKQYLDSLQ